MSNYVWIAAAIAFSSIWLTAGLLIGSRLIRLRERRVVPWQAPDVLVLLLFWILIPASVATLARGDRPAGSPLDPAPVSPSLLVLVGACSLCVVATGIGGLVLVRRTTLHDLGMERLARHLPGDLLLAFVGLLMAIPGVFALQASFTTVYQKQHPLIEQLRRDAYPMLWTAVLFVVVVVAPIVEEIVFRLLIQGWLERLEANGWIARRVTSRVAAGEDVSDDANVDESQEPVEIIEPELPDSLHPFTSPSMAGQTMNTAASGLPLGALPILLSSVAFVLMHIGQGPAPISLIPLAVVLGWIYHRTHRIIPCILCHAAFNGLNIGLLWVATRNG